MFLSPFAAVTVLSPDSVNQVDRLPGFIPSDFPVWQNLRGRLQQVEKSQGSQVIQHLRRLILKRL